MLLGTIQCADGAAPTHRVATVEQMAVSKLDVISLRRSGSEWKALLKGDIEGMPEAIRGQMES